MSSVLWELLQGLIRVACVSPNVFLSFCGRVSLCV